MRTMMKFCSKIHHLTAVCSKVDYLSHAHGFQCQTKGGWVLPTPSG